MGLRAMGVLFPKNNGKKDRKRIKEYGLEGQVEIELIDYRDRSGFGRTFDRIVSIGMLEHVGRPNFPLYMEDASDMLKDGGLFLLHHSMGSPLKRKQVPGFVNISSRWMFAVPSRNGQPRL